MPGETVIFDMNSITEVSEKLNSMIKAGWIRKK